MADAFFNYYTDRNSVVPKAWSVVNAAVLNGGIARDSIEQKSNVTLGDVLGAMPYDSDLVLMNMTGRDLLNMFEFGVTNFTWLPDLNGRFFKDQVFGWFTTSVCQMDVALFVASPLCKLQCTQI
uniref:5'-nucleotidase n=1 Tax=Rhipicephalus microplus TaxID=6941 RepID=A0A6G5ACX3_RHIMP